MEKENNNQVHKIRFPIIIHRILEYISPVHKCDFVCWLFFFFKSFYVEIV